MIRVLVNGALGRMGGEVCKKVFAEPDLELVGAVDIKEGTIALGEGVPVSTDLVAAIEATKPQVVVDFTRPDVVMGNLRKMLPLGVHAVVGTTGFKDADLKEVDALARANNTSILIAPNFALGAVVMLILQTALAAALRSCSSGIPTALGSLPPYSILSMEPFTAVGTNDTNCK